MTRPSLQDATRGHVGAVAPCYVLHNQHAPPDNPANTPDVSHSNAAVQLSGSHGRQNLFLVYGDANAASAPAGSYATNNTSGQGTEDEDEMISCNPNNILFPYHLHQNHGAWNKTIETPNPESLQPGQLFE
ncbi:MAG: hypothetical protein Q9M17_05890 [Mariprofundus sp.]|nr:hypothetical protein [Mariprofundus sp.]